MSTTAAAAPDARDQPGPTYIQAILRVRVNHVQELRHRHRHTAPTGPTPTSLPTRPTQHGGAHGQGVHHTSITRPERARGERQTERAREPEPSSALKTNANVIRPPPHPPTATNGSEARVWSPSHHPGHSIMKNADKTANTRPFSAQKRGSRSIQKSSAARCARSDSETK